LYQFERALLTIHMLQLGMQIRLRDGNHRNFVWSYMSLNLKRFNKHVDFILGILQRSKLI